MLLLLCVGLTSPLLSAELSPSLSSPSPWPASRPSPSSPSPPLVSPPRLVCSPPVDAPPRLSEEQMVLLCHVKLWTLKLYILRMDVKRNLSLAPEVVLVGLLNFLHSVDLLVHGALLCERGGCERRKFNAQTHTCCSFWSVTHDSV